ncbi:MULTISPECIES: magnesium transporter MgtE N-terminal domain-containing protein [Streptomyces]|uniref:magnesium transporter MgtE N-terminal domain-containing protein n=1 Tax=Streptomyces TaxID=1883 RepID=UPI000C27AD50|nr:CBS domain-containing protein [Streptomyces sp. CB01201]MBX7466412.1 CBS domain-containing protein [Streptomyces sp. MAG02]PJM99004.1 magnesium transporter MgtE [Streptomyces sp. CB01201]
MSASHLLMTTSARLRDRRVKLARRALAAKTVRGSLVSVAGLVKGPVTNQAGDDVGRVVDVVARLYGTDSYPPVTGLVIRVGRRRAFLQIDTVEQIDAGRVRLRTARMDLREYERRPGEVLLARDVLDHQLVDVDGIQVTRAADLYLAPLAERIVLVGVDVSLPTLLRRLGPRRWQARPTPERVLDWQSIAPFAEHATEGPAEVSLRGTRASLHRLRPADLADVLEDLGRAERQQLLTWLEPGHAADALEEMEPGELENLLREAGPSYAAQMLGEMEPDEAVDALRDLGAGERSNLLDRMAPTQATGLRGLLARPEDTAGGAMTTRLVTALREHSVARVRGRLAEQAEHRTEIDAVAVVDTGGRLIADVPLFHLTVAEDSSTMGELVDWLAQFGPQVAVRPDTPVDEVADHLLASRASSLLVVDENETPLGRLLADDILDALLPERGRRHFRRFLR